MIFFTVLENPARTDEDARILFVKQGFNWLALLSPVLWCLYRGALLALGLWLALLAGVAAAGELLALPPDALIAIMVGLQLLFAFTANDWRRFMLTRQGYEIIALAAGRSLAEAELSYFRALAQGGRSAPTRAAARLGLDLGDPLLVPAWGEPARR